MSAKKKTVPSEPKRTRTVYAWYPEDLIDEQLLNNILDGGYNDTIEECKADVDLSDEGPVYVYKITVERILKGTQPSFQWVKE